MKGLIRFSVKHPISVLMILTGCIFCSLISLFSIQMDYLPILKDRYLIVTAEFTGAAAKDVRNFITIPVEDSLASLKGVKNITSTTRDSMAIILVELQWNADSNIALTDCRQLIDQCYETLPSGILKPDVKIFNPNLKETVTVLVGTKDGDLEFARYICDTDIKGRLQRLSGISNVVISGGEKSQIQIQIDKTRAESLGLSLQNIAEILANENFEYPAGTITDGNKEFLFKTSGIFSTLEDIKKTPIAVSDGSSVFLSDIGSVVYGKEKRKAFCMFDGHEVVCIELYKKADASPLEVSSVVNKEMRRLSDLYGNSLTFNVMADSSRELSDSLKQLFYSALVGIIISMIVLLVFFRKKRLSLIVGLIIPFSILFSIFVLGVTGRTLNLLSISGIAIGLGMVVDPAIVTVENIVKKLNESKFVNDYCKTISGAAEQVALSCFGSTLTTLVVFLPFFFFPGIIGQLFSDMAVSVMASIFFSCILTMTFIPACFVLLCRSGSSFKESGINLEYLENIYCLQLKTIFNNKTVLYFSGLVCIILGIICLLGLKKEIQPEMASEKIMTDVLFPDGTSIDLLLKESQLLSKEVSKYNFISNIVISGGIENDNLTILNDPSMRKELLRINCKTKNKEKAEVLFRYLFDKEGYEISFHKNENLLSQVLEGLQATEIIQEDSIEKLSVVTENLKKDERWQIKKIIPENLVEEYVFSPDKVACSRFGISSYEGATIARSTLEGTFSSPFYKEGREIPVLVKYPDDNISNVRDLQNTFVRAGNVSVPLSAIGDVNIVESEKILYRYNRKDSKKVFCNLSEQRDKLDFERTFRLINPTQEQMDELMKSGIVLLFIVLIMLYCVMGAQFESFLIPVFLLIAIPPAFTGAFSALLLSGNTLNINSIVALVVLFGTSVNNAIILYEAIISEKEITVSSVINVCGTKLRPILITTLTTVFALFPFAIDIGNMNPQSSMAVAIIGGLVFSFVIVLFAIPLVLYLTLKNKSAAKNLQEEKE